jgi:hypothetical protein
MGENESMLKKSWSVRRKDVFLHPQKGYLIVEIVELDKNIQTTK